MESDDSVGFSSDENLDWSRSHESWWHFLECWEFFGHKIFQQLLSWWSTVTHINEDTIQVCHGKKWDTSLEMAILSRQVGLQHVRHSRRNFCSTSGLKTIKSGIYQVKEMGEFADYSFTVTWIDFFVQFNLYLTQFKYKLKMFTNIKKCILCWKKVCFSPNNMFMIHN